MNNYEIRRNTSIGGSDFRTPNFTLFHFLLAFLVHCKFMGTKVAIFTNNFTQFSNLKHGSVFWEPDGLLGKQGSVF